MKNNRSIYTAMLLIILLIFSFRVVAQMVQYFHPVEALPQFEEWQSGVLPYPVLLLAQLIILFILVQTIGRYFRGSVRMGRKRGIVFLLGGGGYFLVMVARLLASVFFNKNESWFFDGALPAFFHVMLSCFVITHGYFIFGRQQQ
ncbi:MAG: hypothetical protein VX294_01730 [Candidatus Latescibacterota bacterium]|nr:hypothetical protein [Candidatus Latescibacterota bacterium]